MSIIPLALVSVCVLAILGLWIFVGAAFHFSPNLYVANPATVSGLVTLDGKPLPLARITFVSTDGFAAEAEVLDGKYEVRGLQQGKRLKVLVVTSRLILQKKVNDWKEAEAEIQSLRPHRFLRLPDETVQRIEQRLEELKDKLKAYRTNAKSYVYIPIPTHYGSEQATPFSFTPQGEVEEFDLNLEES